jgi:hypothetical protein
MGMRKGGRATLMPSNYQGDGSTLNLDFTTGVLDSRLTFSRAGGGTYVGPDGYIYGVDSATSASLAIGTGSKSVTLTATAGVDRRFQVGQTVYFSSGANNMSGLVTAYNASTQVITINATAPTGSGSFTSWFVGNASPRFDYSPTNIGEPRGLLIEGQATNMCRWSIDTGSWDGAVTGVTKTTETIVAPSGVSTSVDRWVASASSYKTFNATGGLATTNYTLSMWVRTVSGTGTFGLRVNNLSDGSNQSFNNATITTTWQRLQVTFNNTAAGTLQGGMAQWSAIGGPGTAIDVYVWGAQLELGSSASSFIPTVASQVTRNADSCLMSGTNFSSWYSQGKGTVVWTGSAFRTTAGHLANINTVNNDPRITAYVGAGALTNLVTNGTTQVSMFFGSITANTAFKAAWRFDTNDFAAVLNNGTVYTDTSGTVPTGVDRMQIGAAEGGYQFLDGWVKSIKYYPTAIDNSALKATTTTVVSADVLVVAGGGGGGGTTYNAYGGGGGGAGGLVYASGVNISTGVNYTVTIGAGGAAGVGSGGAVEGSPSSISGLGLTTAVGGGRGGRGNGDSVPGTNGGSGGGAGGYPGQPNGLGTSGQGFAGGQPGAEANPYRGAGGGGASAAGTNGNASSGNAGNGTAYFGSSYAGGGGGGSTSTYAVGAGGTGGGGGGGNFNGTTGTAGTANTGGGGGGAGTPSAAGSTTGGIGGSGIVIVRYPGSPIGSVTGTTNTTSEMGGYTFHTFRVTGNLVMT